MQDFDKLWNYGDPAATEVKFREVLNDSSNSGALSRHLQLLSQIARTQGLQRKYQEAHKTLDEVEPNLPEEYDVAHIRYFLERGRVFNSSGDKRNAEVCFRQSMDIAQKLSEDFYTIDAIHMLAIIATPDQSIRLNEQGILLSEASSQERAKNWLGSLYNNLGWGYFDKGAYEQALSIFLRALKWREDKKQTGEIFIAKWCVARTLRAQNKTEEALKIQLGLFEEAMNTGQHDGYVHEELGELFLITNDKKKSGFHFTKAYELLSTDIHFRANEKERLSRIQSLADPKV